MKYVTALKDYNHRQTGEKVITEGMAYLVFKEKQLLFRRSKCIIFNGY